MKPTDYVPNGNSQQRSSPDACIHHQQAGLNREARAALLRVRMRPECPEGSLRELTEDSNSNCETARERGKKRQNYLSKSPNLRHGGVHSQNKGLYEYQRRASWLRTSPSPEAGRQAAAWCKLRPRDSMLYQLLPKISWDSGWLTSTGRVAARDQLPRRDPRHTGDGVPTASQEFERLGPGR